MPTMHVIIEGLVQGVAFREYTRRQAVSLGVNGWVRNLANGAVEATIQAPAAEVEAMIEWLHRGSPHSRVDRVQVVDGSETPVFSSFEIRF